MMLKPLSLFLFFCCSISCFAQKKTLDLQVTYTEPYCGGARPSQEMIEQANRAKPYRHQKMTLVSSSGKTYCVKTDETGFIHIKLKPGEYRLFESWRYYKRVPYKLNKKDMDMACLKTEWGKELCVITVGQEKNELSFKYDLFTYCPWAVPCLLESSRPAMPQ